MRETRHNPAVRLLPSLTDVAFIMPLVFLFGRLDGAKALLGDGDTGWHIRAGEWILANGRVPDRDIFSFTKPGEPWFAWEWLWDACFAWLHGRFGMAAVLLVSALTLSLTFAFLYRLARRRCGHSLIAIGVTLLAIGASSIHWLARPHLFTLLFTVLTMMAIERRRIWLIPLLTVAWTNLHGGFFVGAVLLAAYAAGEIVRALVAPSAETRAQAWRAARPYGLAAAASLAASLVNPYGFRLHQHIWQYLRDPYQFEHISEFVSLSFQHPVAVYFEPLVLLGVVAAFWSAARGRYADAILTAGWAHLALFAARNIPIYAIVATPVIAVAAREMAAAVAAAPIAAWLKRAAGAVETAGRELTAVDSLPRIYAVSAASLALIAAVFYAPAPPAGFRAEYDVKRYPAQALEKLASLPGPIFTDDEWGDYLIYRLYPGGRKVFVDGRSDFYGSKFGLQYLDMLNVKHGWEQNLDRYAIETVLLPVETPLAGALKESRRWQAIYDDGIAIAFRRAPGAPISTLTASGKGCEREIAAKTGGKLARL